MRAESATQARETCFCPTVANQTLRAHSRTGTRLMVEPAEECAR